MTVRALVWSLVRPGDDGRKAVRYSFAVVPDGPAVVVTETASSDLDVKRGFEYGFLHGNGPRAGMPATEHEALMSLTRRLNETDGWPMTQDPIYMDLNCEPGDIEDATPRAGEAVMVAVIARV